MQNIFVILRKNTFAFCFILLITINFIYERVPLLLKLTVSEALHIYYLFVEMFDHYRYLASVINQAEIR